MDSSTATYQAEKSVRRLEGQDWFQIYFVLLVVVLFFGAVAASNQTPAAVRKEDKLLVWNPPIAACPADYPTEVRLDENNAYKIQCTTPEYMLAVHLCALTEQGKRLVWLSVRKDICPPVRQTLTHELLHIAVYEGGGRNPKIPHEHLNEDHDFIMPAEAPLTGIFQNSPDLMRWLNEKDK